MATFATLCCPFFMNKVRRELLYYLNSWSGLALCLASAFPKGVFMCTFLRTFTENCISYKNEENPTQQLQKPDLTPLLVPFSGRGTGCKVGSAGFCCSATTLSK